MRFQYSILLLTFSCICQTVYSSECGESTIPYSLEVLSNGQPILGCARPTCFGWQPNGRQLLTTAKFFRIDQQSDGFLRDDPLAIQTFDATDPRVYSQQSATCEPEYQSLSCDQEDQWVGGIAPVLDAKANNIVAYKCCSYSPLRASTDRGIATVAHGQIVIGGEVKESGKQYAFDYISNIEKKYDEEGDVFYEVNIRRFSCLDLQNVDRSVAEVLNAENIIRHVNGQKPVAFQAPNVEVAAPIETGELVVPQGVVDGQEVVIEEIVAQSGFIQPETTIVPPTDLQPVQPQGLQQGFQPQPQGFQPQPQGFQPQPQGFQPQPQGFQPQPQGFPQSAFQQPVQIPVDGAANYGYMPMGFASPTTLQMYYCFPGDALVNTKNGGQKRMDELDEGDWVVALENNGNETILTPVLYWLHRDPNQEATFIEFEVDSGDRFALTEKHLVYISTHASQNKVEDINAHPIPAEKVEIGDYFFFATTYKSKSYYKVKVVNIRSVVKRGIYAPMTSTGHLLVNKIHTSCHSENDIYSLQSSFFKPVLSFKKKLMSYFQDILPNEESGLGIGANALLDVLDLVLPAKLIV